MGTVRDPNRRTVLKWVAIGATALAGGIAAGVAGARPGVTTGAQRLTLAGRSWRVLGMTRGELPASGAQHAITGELLGTDGQKHGEFYATSVFVGAPHGAGDSAASYVETHHFNLVDGTLVGSGTWYVSGASRFVILAGTGRYAGATGTYEAIQRPIELGGNGTAVFNFDLTIPGGG